MLYLLAKLVVVIVADPRTPKTRGNMKGFLKGPKKMGKITPKNQNLGQ